MGDVLNVSSAYERRFWVTFKTSLRRLRVNHKNITHHPLLSVSSYLSTQASAQECAKSMIRTNWIRMKRKPPIMPKYIQTSPKLPRGMKKAPIIPPIRIRYLMAQNLEKQKKKKKKKGTSKYKPTHRHCNIYDITILEDISSI